jgi:hypothetical protein
MLGSLYATNIAGLSILGLEGWRFAFLTVAAFSGGLALAVALFVDDPRCPKRCLRVPRNLVIAVHGAADGTGASGCRVPCHALCKRWRGWGSGRQQ